MSKTSVTAIISKIFSVTDESATITLAIKGLVVDLHGSLAGQSDTSFDTVFTGDLVEIVKGVYDKCEQLNHDTKKRNSYMNTINKAMQRSVKEIVKTVDDAGGHCFFCDVDGKVRQLAVTTGTKTERRVGVKFKDAKADQTLTEYVANINKYLEAHDISVDAFRKEFNKQNSGKAKPATKPEAVKQAA